MLRRRRGPVAAITGLNTIGLAVVTVRSLSSVQAVSPGGQHALDGLVVPGSSAGKSDNYANHKP